MLVTPQQAEEWLKRNTNNRKLREGMSFRYAQDMESGRWEYNGDPIRFAPDGTLIDGQHRLTACVLSKTAFDTDVIFNLSTRLCDIGGVRTASDMADLSGIKNSARVCALAKMVLIHRQHGIAKLNSTMLHPSKTEILNEVMSNDKLQGSLMFLPRLAPQSVTDFCSYVFREQNLQMAQKFMTDVLVGDGLSKGNAAFPMRQRLILNKQSKGKLNSLYLIALFFVAWKHYRDGKPLRSLRWSEASEFPDITTKEVSA